jgi:hypothetical protein
VRVIGGEGRLDIGGTLEIVDGRYLRKFNLFDDVIKPQRTSTPSKPFWEASPLLAGARLDLKVLSQAFYVRNNLADISLAGQVRIGGTPRAPRFDGVVRITDGTFKMLGVRARFERAAGRLLFEPLRQFPSQTPSIDVRAESDYTDTTGQPHLIHLTMDGTLSNLNWDLRTEKGLNRTQTLQLLVAGRTPEELRRALGDTSIGGGPGQFADASATNETSGFVLADQLIKDLSSDFFALLIGDQLRNITDLDVVRLQVGTNALGLHVEKKITASLRGIGEAEQSLRGNYAELTGEYKLTDAWSIDARTQRRNFNDETLKDEQKQSAQMTWRWVLLP